jgi:hypothetical protein
MRILFAICLVIGFLPIDLSAQRYVDVAKVQYQNFPSNNFGVSSSNTSMNDWSASIFLPIELKSKDMIVFGTRYGLYELDDSEDLFESESLTQVSLNIGGIKKWKDGKWSVMILALPKLSSDMKAVTEKHYQMGGVSLFTYERNKDFKYKFGLYYNREFFGNFFMPLAGFEYSPSDRFVLSVMAPRALHAEYKISPKFYTGFSHKSIVSSFMLSANDGAYYLREGHPFWGSRQNKLFVDYYPLKSLVVYAEFGITTGRSFAIHNSAFKEEVVEPVFTGVNPIYQDVANNLFFNVGVAFRKRLDR